MRNRLESIFAGFIGAAVMALLLSPVIRTVEASYVPVPSGTIAHFNATSCPSGWTEFTTARGVTIVGRVATGAAGDGKGVLNTVVGTALTDQENRAVGQHTHTNTQAATTQAAHSHNLETRRSGGSATGVERLDGLLAGLITTSWDNAVNVKGTDTVTPVITNGAVTINNSGTVAGTNAPYIQLLVCSKS